MCNAASGGVAYVNINMGYFLSRWPFFRSDLTNAGISISVTVRLLLGALIEWKSEEEN